MPIAPQLVGNAPVAPLPVIAFAHMPILVVVVLTDVNIPSEPVVMLLYDADNVAEFDPNIRQ